MMKLNVAWDLGPIESDGSQAMFDMVTPPFISRQTQRTRRQMQPRPSVLNGLSAVEIDFIHHASEMLIRPYRTPCQRTACIILEGVIQAGSQEYPAGTSFGSEALLRRMPCPSASARPGSRLLRLSLRDFDALCERYPRLGMKLYRKLAEAGR
jgi:CRP-like cAMP-binding protein